MSLDRRNFLGGLLAAAASKPAAALAKALPEPKPVPGVWFGADAFSVPPIDLPLPVTLDPKFYEASFEFSTEELLLGPSGYWMLNAACEVDEPELDTYGE